MSIATGHFSINTETVKSGGYYSQVTGHVRGLSLCLEEATVCTFRLLSGQGLEASRWQDEG